MSATSTHFPPDPFRLHQNPRKQALHHRLPLSHGQSAGLAACSIHSIRLSSSTATIGRFQVRKPHSWLGLEGYSDDVSLKRPFLGACSCSDLQACPCGESRSRRRICSQARRMETRESWCNVWLDSVSSDHEIAWRDGYSPSRRTCISPDV